MPELLVNLADMGLGFPHGRFAVNLVTLDPQTTPLLDCQLRVTRRDMSAGHDRRRELSNWIIIGENYQLLQGNGTSPNQTGLFNATGTLTRQYNSIGGDTIIDTVLEAVTDIRVGGAYAQADLILLHPNDWLAMRKLKTRFNS